MKAPAEPRPERRAARWLAALEAVPRNVLWRFALFATLVGGAFLALRWPPIAERLTQDTVVAFFDALRGQWWAPVVLVVLHAIGGVVGMPSSPLVVGGGAVFGPFLGTGLNLLGLMVGAWLGFEVARRLGRDLVRHLAGDRLRRAERLFERRGFWPLVSLRFFPLPFSAINFGAALAGIRLPRFMITTALGLVPTIAMHTSFASWLASAPEADRVRILATWLTLWLGLGALTAYPTWRSARKRRRRYRELLAQRRRRVR